MEAGSQKGGGSSIALRCEMSQVGADELALSDEQAAKAQRIYERLDAVVNEERMRMAR